MFKGITTALITPFLKGKLDRESFIKLLEFQVHGGVNSFVLNGTTGESPTLDEEEVQTLCLWFKDFEKSKNKKLTLLLGTGTFSTQGSVQKTKKAHNLGADGVLVVTPYYNKPPQEGLLEHFSSIASSTSLPVILYNVPSRTSSSLSLQTIKKLSAISNIVGIKEASGDINFLKEIKQQCGKDFLFLSGDDFTAVDSFFQGGDGVISVCSHALPQEMTQFFQRALKGDQQALTEFKQWMPFLKNLYHTTNPIGIKQLLQEMKVIASGELRLPLKAPEQKDQALVDSFFALSSARGLK